MTTPSEYEQQEEQQGDEPLWRRDPALNEIVRTVNAEMRPSLNDRYDAWAVAHAAVAAYQKSTTPSEADGVAILDIPSLQHRRDCPSYSAFDPSRRLAITLRKLAARRKKGSE